MGLRLYNKRPILPPDHNFHEYMEKLPDRFEKHKFYNNWVIEGLYEDEDADEYYFVLSCDKPQMKEIFSVSKSSLLFEEKAVDNLISKMLVRCMEVEFNAGTAQRLMGAKAEEKSGDDDIYVVDDFSRGTGEVTHRRVTRNDDDTSPEDKSGGLIISSR